MKTIRYQITNKDISLSADKRVVAKGLYPESFHRKNVTPRSQIIM